jgi:hypothetical protein
VGPTFSMLAASLLVAQTADPSKPCNCQKGAAPVAATSSAQSPGPFRGLFRSSSEPAPVVEERPTMMSRIQGLFGKKSETAEPAPIVMPQQQYVEQAKPSPFRLMQRLPAGQPNTDNAGAPLVPLPPAPVKTVQPVTYQGVPANQIAPAANTVLQASTQAKVLPARPNRITPGLSVGHENDYSWITGQLRVENGLYVIYYAAPEVVDAHNGNVVLTSDRDLRGFHDGDYVSIRGSLAGSANGRSLYRVTAIDRVPR